MPTETFSDFDITSFSPQVPNSGTTTYQPGLTNAVMQQIGIPLGTINNGGAPDQGLTGAPWTR